jgi:hypothetical protein
MKIHCLTTFLDDKDRFEEGETRVVDDARGYKFIGLGWACVPGDPAVVPSTTDSVNLDINSSAHAAGDSNG